MGGGAEFGYAEGFEATEGFPAPRSPLSPFSAIAAGAWYGLVFASAMSLGLDYVSTSHDTHPYLSSLASALGAGMGAGLCSLLARKWKMVIALLATVPCAAIWLVVINLGNRKLDPVLFEWRPSAFWVGVTFTALTLLCGAAGGVIGAQEITPDGFGEQLLNVRPRHWLWLWIAAGSWVSMIPVVAYYLWLELATSGYVLIHPSLWFNASWDKDVAFGLMPGIIGIAGLAYGIDLSLRSVAPPKKGESTKRRVGMFLLGTVVLATVVASFFLNWGIAHLKDMPLMKNSAGWWIL